MTHNTISRKWPGFNLRIMLLAGFVQINEHNHEGDLDSLLFKFKTINLFKE